MDPIRVLIVDDQAITRTGLKAMLTGDVDGGERSDQPGIVVVGEAHDGDSCIALALELQPDVILMDLRMPGINGIEATRRIHRQQPHVGILVVTVFSDDTSVFPAIRAGARGYLLKDAALDELVQAIHTVARGGAIFSPGIASRVMRYLSAETAPVPDSAMEELTGRERTVLAALAEGLSNAEIAARLGVSAKTVSNNVSNILAKLQAVDRARLMLLALEAGMGNAPAAEGADDDRV